jgi:choline kinase
MSIRHAIILAAGNGSRMGSLTADRPKAMLEVAGQSLIDRQLEALSLSGIDDVTIVTGYLAPRLQNYLGSRVKFVHNDRYCETNSLYSLWLARETLALGSVVMNSDTLVSPKLISRLMHSPVYDAALVDPRDNLGAEEMKVKLSNGFIIDFSKELRPEDSDGENVGILKFGKQAGRRLVRHLDALVGDGKVNAWAPMAFAALAKEWPLAAISTHGIPWTEIDYPEDLVRAERELAPLLAQPEWSQVAA